MPRKTLSSMHDARDVEDKRLLEAGDHKLLLAGYFHAVRELCFLRLRDREAADEAAQIVLLRLLRELKRARRTACPSASSSEGRRVDGARLLPGREAGRHAARRLGSR